MKRCGQGTTNAQNPPRGFPARKRRVIEHGISKERRERHRMHGLLPRQRIGWLLGERFRDHKPASDGRGGVEPPPIDSPRVTSWAGREKVGLQGGSEASKTAAML